MVRFRVLVEQDENGVFSSECPCIPGCVSQGRTRDEALANITNAIEGHLASLKKCATPTPPAIWEETVEVDV